MHHNILNEHTVQRECKHTEHTHEKQSHSSINTLNYLKDTNTPSCRDVNVDWSIFIYFTRQVSQEQILIFNAGLGTVG